MSQTETKEAVKTREEIIAEIEAELDELEILYIVGQM